MHSAVALLVVSVLFIVADNAQQAPKPETTATENTAAQNPEPFFICSQQNLEKGCIYACKDPHRPQDEPCIDTPHATFAPDPEYSEQARKSRAQGTVLLEIVVDANGQVASAKVLRGLEPGLDQNSRDTVRRWQFDPAKVEGKAVPIRLQVMMSFRLYSSPRRSFPPVVIRKP